MTVFLCHGVLSRAFLQQSSVSTSMAGCPVGPLLQHGHGLPSPLTGLQANTARVALLVSNQQGRLVLTPSSPRGSLRGTVNTRHSCEWPASGLAADSCGPPQALPRTRETGPMLLGQFSWQVCLFPGPRLRATGLLKVVCPLPELTWDWPKVSNSPVLWGSRTRHPEGHLMERWLPEALL